MEDIAKMNSVTEMDIDAVVPYDRNPRLNDDAVEAVAQSIRQYGWQQPIVVDRDNVIIVGHTRRLAALRLGLKTVPVVVAGNLTPEQAKAYRLDDNKSGELATWDFAMLKEEIGELEELGYDMGTLAFGEDEISRILADEDGGDGKTDGTGGEAEDGEDYDSMDSDGVPVSMPGECYRLGNHVLMCGDATDESHRSALLGGEKVKMVYTDPPYGMNLDTDFSNMESKINGSHGGNGYYAGRVDEFHPEMVESALAVESDECFLWGADYFAELIPGRNDGSWIVWDKRSDEGQSAEEGDSAGRMFGSEFELCWSKRRHKRCIVRRKWAGVFGIHGEGEVGKRFHPTQKPVVLAEWFIDAFTDKGECVVDLFAGSGSALVACEKKGRKCLAMEIDPHYCDVIRKRWAEEVHGKGCDWQALTPVIA